MRTLKMCGLCMCMLAGCATHAGNNVQGSQNNVSAAIPNTGLVMKKEESEHIQIVLFIAPEVASVVGVEMFDTLRNHGWVQVTTADASDTTEVDVICRLGADSARVAAECGVVNPQVKTPLSTGSIAIGTQVMNKFGPGRVRNAVADLVGRQYVAAVNTAVAFFSSQKR